MIFPKFVAPHHMGQLSSYGNARSAPPQSATTGASQSATTGPAAEYGLWTVDRINAIDPAAPEHRSPQSSPQSSAPP